MAIVVVAVVLAILGVLVGWLGPLVVKASRPIGVGGDIIVSVLVMVILGVIEWQFVLPAFGMGFGGGWLRWLATIGDPLVLALVAMWLVRKVKS
jgi:hypothetical protein